MRVRFHFAQMLLIAVLALLAACATGPGTVEVSQQQLQTALERRFPYELRPAGLFIVKLGAPRLQLLPASNRLRLDLGLDASERITRKSGRGDLGLSFGLRYEPSDTSIRATDVRVEQLDLHDLPEGWRNPVELAGALVVEHLLDGAVLHAFRPEELARAQGRRPGAIRVTPTGVSLELLPQSSSSSR
jgi:hypothetical protein